MRRAILLCMLATLLVAAGWHSLTRRSTAVELGPNLTLTYTVSWGFGMSQRFTFGERWKPWASISTEWIKIWDKPYNSGAAVYASEDGKTYYIGTSYILIVIGASQKSFEMRCDSSLALSRTGLAQQLLVYGFRGQEQIDPGAPPLFGYLDQSAHTGTLPYGPPQSKYYKAVRYLGKFGIIAEGNQNRGSGVGFVSAEDSPEPRLGLEANCG